jgi:acetyl-CoA carboxylase biotin carboxylase subunit
MRVVGRPAEIGGAFEAAASEAAKAFGDGSVYLERYVERPRHIEVQVLADASGTVVAIGERECSIQRRHQKLIEEAPSPAVDPELRHQLAEAACAAARAVGYQNAGTVEFLLAADGSFYFLEMNTRIQVEHPVTELVYGVDLVRMQLRLANGANLEPMELLEPRGHAIECRITAEDVASGFLPVTGRIAYLHQPAGPGIRWDGGLEAGSDVTLHYDSLIGKLIVWAESRPLAIQRMRRALRELVIAGVPTSQPFHLRVMDEPTFARGDLDITYVERVGARLVEAPPSDEHVRAAAVAAALLADERRSHPFGIGTTSDGRARSGWAAAAREEALRR